MGKGRAPYEPIEQTFLSTGNPRLVYIGTDQMAYELDDDEFPVDGRESDILALLMNRAKQALEHQRFDNRNSRTSGT